MILFDFLQTARGVTAVVGSGGKTSLLAHLAREADGRTCLTTSTHILPFERYPLATSWQELQRARACSSAVCVGSPARNGKLGAPPISFAELTELFDHVLAEADGSRHLPLKAHAPWEPVVPPEAQQVVLVMGAHGLGRCVGEAVHRVELFCELTGCAPDDCVTPHLAARAVAQECVLGRIAPTHIVINTALGGAGAALAQELQQFLPCIPTAAFNLKP